MKRTYKRQAIEKELNEMVRVKSTLSKTIDELRSKQDHLILSIDDIVFSNIVLLDKLYKNMDTLRQLVRK